MAERARRSRLLLIVALVAGVAVLSGAVAAGVTVVLLRIQSRASSPDVGSLLPFSDESTVTGVAQKVLPSVVSLVDDQRGRPVAAGSAFIVRGDGYLVTNTQVLAGASGLGVILPKDSKRHDARVVDFDCATGIAVLKIDQVSGLPALGFADSSALRPGQTLLAAGGPLEGGGALSRGIASTLHRNSSIADPLAAGREQEFADTLTTDARLDPATAGGPLVNTGGQVVAVLLGSGPQPEAVGIAANDVAPVVDQIVSTGQLLVASLDATVTEVPPEDAALRGTAAGSLVEDVKAGGVAAAAGLRAGDVITQLDDVKVDPGHPLLQLLRTRFKPGQRVTVSYTRGTASSQVQLTLHGEHPACS